MVSKNNNNHSFSVEERYDENAAFAVISEHAVRAGTDRKSVV